MGSWKDAFPSKWLKASDLEDKPHLWTVKKVAREKLQDGTYKLAVWFREESKPLLLNKTNAKSIEKATGSDDTDVWIGKRVVVFPTETEMGGETVDCIRIRAPKTGAKLPPPPPVEDEEPEENLRDDFVPSDDDVPF